jgi:hypothetical protein
MTTVSNLPLESNHTDSHFSFDKNWFHASNWRSLLSEFELGMSCTGGIFVLRGFVEKPVEIQTISPSKLALRLEILLLIRTWG